MQHSRFARTAICRASQDAHLQHCFVQVGSSVRGVNSWVPAGGKGSCWLSEALVVHASVMRFTAGTGAAAGPLKLH